MDKGEFRVDSICKMNTFSHMDSIKDKISIECSDKAMNISDQLSVTRSIVSTEVATGQGARQFRTWPCIARNESLHNTYVWLLTGVCYVLDSVRLKLGVDNYLPKEGLRTKLDMSSNLTALIERN